MFPKIRVPLLGSTHAMYAHVWYLGLYVGSAYLWNLPYGNLEPLGLKESAWALPPKKQHRSIQEITRKVRQEGSTTAACTEIVNAHETPTALSQRCRDFMVSDFTAKP